MCACFWKWVLRFHAGCSSKTGSHSADTLAPLTAGTAGCAKLAAGGHKPIPAPRKQIYLQKVSHKGRQLALARSFWLFFFFVLLACFHDCWRYFCLLLFPEVVFLGVYLSEVWKGNVHTNILMRTLVTEEKAFWQPLLVTVCWQACTIAWLLKDLASSGTFQLFYIKE